MKLNQELLSKDITKIATLEERCQLLESELRAARSQKDSPKQQLAESNLQIKDLNRKLGDLTIQIEMANRRIIDLEDVNADLRETDRQKVI